MIKAIPVMAVLAMAIAAPALAQQQYPADNSTTSSQPSLRDETDQQARTPSDQRSSGEVETLRQRGMSSPNVKGEAVPEDPNTGVPEAQQRNREKQMEGAVPRP